MNPNNPIAGADVRQLQEAAQTVGKQIVVFKASSAAEFEPAFKALESKGALFVNADPFFNSQQPELVALAAKYSVPTIYELRGFAEAGGLASYGSSITENYRRVGIYAGQILNGARPADLPVIQPTTFELVINLRTAKILGLEITPNLLALADKVIE
jgi:putative tryptophan/tyrosine transport system substrate-binding protein